ncbi:hypothetical protein N7G274_009808 [Stereocaulon virgatum]|uniref:Chromosome condensation protein n=1 Tax=Stereocaulon virgatum TaxID=373712 RepID=A0ABR3ZV91_9LECA
MTPAKVNNNPQDEGANPSQSHQQKAGSTPNDRNSGEQQSKGFRSQLDSKTSRPASNKKGDGRDDYMIPDLYSSLDEPGVPSPVTSQSQGARQPQAQQGLPGTSLKGRSNEEQNPGRRQPYSKSKHSHPPPNDRDDGEEEYTIPDDYQNLDEIAAPSPVASPVKEREQGYLEDRRTSNTVEDNLDELAVPSPVASPHEDREQGYLEDRNTGSPSSDEEVKQEVPSWRQRASKLATEVYTVSYLIFFSILGTLARLGLQALTFYPGAPVQTGILWANVGGTLILGFLSEDRKLFQEGWGFDSSQRPKAKDEEKGQNPQRSPSVDKRHAAAKKTLPLYIGLAIGFCGSFTSFSSFMRDAFLALSNALHVPISHPSIAPISETVNLHRNPGYSFLALLAVLIMTVGLSLMAFQFGAHTALFLEPYIPSIPFLFTRRVVDRLFVFLGWGCWLAAIVMAIFPPDRPGGPVGDASWSQERWRSQALFALVFAPLGCLLRFYVSLHLNGRIKSFPLGTFVVNMFGTAMLAMFLDLQRVPIGGMIGCQVLQGMSDGFDGCLTTVSTWIAELTGLRLKHAYFYGMMSVGVALSLMVVIMGSLQWTHGFKDPSCTA